jgi:hypothetical protein
MEWMILEMPAMRPPNTPGDILINVNSFLEDGSLFRKDFYIEDNFFAISGATNIRKTGKGESVRFFVKGFERFTSHLISPSDHTPPRFSCDFGYQSGLQGLDFWGRVDTNFRDPSMCMQDVINIFGGKWSEHVSTMGSTFRPSVFSAFHARQEAIKKDSKWDYLEDLSFRYMDSVRSYDSQIIRARIGADPKGGVGYFSFGCHKV